MTAIVMRRGRSIMGNDALFSCALAPSSRNPFSVVNAVALILTALPPTFHQPLYEEIGAVLISSELAASDPNVCFSSFERDSYLMSDNKIMAVLALAHAFWQHATIATLSVLPEYVRIKDRFHIKLL